MIGRTLGGATVATLQGMIVFVISMIVGFRPVSIPLAFVGFIIMLLIAILFTALGTAIASKLDDFQGFQLIMNFLIMPLFFLSGALFPLQGIPKVLSYVIAVDPLSYGVDGLRAALIGTGHYGLIPDIIILGSITAVLLAIGTYFFSKIQI
jgi:ABC-2 type transport system permease protein